MKGKRILILQQRGWAINIGHFLAKKLQGEGCRLAALTIKPITHEFVLNQTEVKYDLICSHDEIMARPQAFLGSDNFSLQEICDFLEVDSIWPFVMSLRHFVKSYKDKYYYGFKQNVSDDDIVKYVKACFKCARDMFEKFDPELIIAPNFVSFPHIIFNLYARKRGIKMIAITDSRIKGYYLMGYDYNDSEGEFWQRVDELNGGAISKSLPAAKKYIKEFRESFKKPDYLETFLASQSAKKSFWKILRHEISPYKQILRWYIKSEDSRKNYIEGLGPTIDYRPPMIILRDHYAHKRNQRFMERYQYYPFEKLGKFIFFPLQFQPESSIDVMAPYFTNQIEVARQIAMSLPGDYTLAVKEHPGMIGLRPPSYIEKLDRTVNVKLIDYRIPSEVILKKADLVISAVSSVLVEAAFLRKPAIQLGNSGISLKMPNVVKHTDFTTLSGKIKEMLKRDFFNEDYEKRLENYVAAVFDTGFNLSYRAIWAKGKGDFDALWKCFEEEINKFLKK